MFVDSDICEMSAHTVGNSFSSVHSEDKLGNKGPLENSQLAQCLCLTHGHRALLAPTCQTSLSPAGSPLKASPSLATDTAVPGLISTPVDAFLALSSPQPTRPPPFLQTSQPLLLHVASTLCRTLSLYVRVGF